MTSRNVLGAIFLCLALASPSLPCESPPRASLKLEARNGALLVPVTLQGQTAYMILSMGSALSSVEVEAADKWGLPVTHYSDSALLANGEKVKAPVRVSDLALGDLILPPQDLMVDPHSHQPGHADSPDILGILGVDLLWGSDIELDLAHGKLLLYTPGQCSGNVVRWSNHADSVPLRRSPNGSAYFSLQLDGRRLQTAFTTTSSATAISTDLARRVFGFDKTTPGLEVVTNTEGHMAFARTMQLTAGAVPLTDEKVFLIDPPKDCVLAKLHIYIDTHDNLLYFTRTDH